MTMFFNHPDVRRFLQEHGRVCTLRLKKRREGRDVLVYGPLYRANRIGMGMVTLLKQIDELRPRALGPYLRWSGFATSRQWIEAFRFITKGREVPTVFLYDVRLLQSAPS